MNILIVEDDASVARFLAQACHEAGYATQVIGDGGKVLELLAAQNFDAILLDVMLPGLNGFEICRRYRAQGGNTPILIITARDTLEDKVQGLDCGADDYVAKPFHIVELLARLRALLRRGQVITTGPLRVADLSLDPNTRCAIRGEKSVSLSATEYTLLEFLMRNEGRVLPRNTILDQVWQYDFGGNDNVLDVYISYLRQKIDKGHAKPLIHTVRGIGFRLAAD